MEASLLVTLMLTPARRCRQSGCSPTSSTTTASTSWIRSALSRLTRRYAGLHVEQTCKRGLTTLSVMELFPGSWRGHLGGHVKPSVEASNLMGGMVQKFPIYWYQESSSWGTFSIVHTYNLLSIHMIYIALPLLGWGLLHHSISKVVPNCHRPWIWNIRVQTSFEEKERLPE